MKKYLITYRASFRYGAEREYTILIEAESFPRAYEKYRKKMSLILSRDRNVEMLKFELLEEEQDDH